MFDGECDPTAKENKEGGQKGLKKVGRREDEPVRVNRNTIGREVIPSSLRVVLIKERRYPVSMTTNSNDRETYLLTFSA